MVANSPQRINTSLAATPVDTEGGDKSPRKSLVSNTGLNNKEAYMKHLQFLESEEQKKINPGQRVKYGVRRPIYSIGYNKLSKLHKYHKSITGNKVHLLTFGLIHANIFIKKLKK